MLTGWYHSISCAADAVRVPLSANKHANLDVVRQLCDRGGSALERTEVELLVGHGDLAKLVGSGATEQADRGIERIDEDDPADPLGMTLGVDPGQISTERVRHQDDIAVRRVVHDGVQLAIERLRGPAWRPGRWAVPSAGTVVATNARILGELPLHLEPLARRCLIADA